MLQLTYLSLLAIAFVTAKLALIDRRAEVLTCFVSMVLFATVSVASSNVQVADGAGGLVTVQQPGLLVLGMGGALVMLVFAVLASLGKLPEPERAVDGLSSIGGAP